MGKPEIVDKSGAGIVFLGDKYDQDSFYLGLYTKLSTLSTFFLSTLSAKYS